MTNPLDTFPLDWSEPVVQDVLGALTGSYRRSKDIEAVVDTAGIDGGNVDFDGTARQIWRSVMKEAARALQLRPLLGLVKSELPALAELIDGWLATVPTTTPPSEHDGHGGPQWKGFSGDSGVERQIVEGHDTLLDIVFLARGLDRARSVCHLRVEAGGRNYVGTGFRIGADLILTNHHVVVVAAKDGTVHAASKIVAWFDYEATEEGVLKPVSVVACNATAVALSETLDWAVVRSTDPIPDRYPALPLDVPVTVEIDDRVYIIQHPNGRPKMIGMLHNIVRSVDGDVIQYWTDTEEGSSGAPVFDERWNVVALHHSWTSNEVDDKTEFRNEGVRIDRVLADVLTAGIHLEV